MGTYIFKRGNKTVAKMSGVSQRTAWKYAAGQKKKFTVWGTPSGVKKNLKEFPIKKRKR